MKKKFGQRLRELRIQKRLIQETMAECIGITPENYSRLENGLSFPKPENLVKIAKALNETVEKIFLNKN